MYLKVHTKYLSKIYYIDTRDCVFCKIFLSTLDSPEHYSISYHTFSKIIIIKIRRKNSLDMYTQKSKIVKNTVHDRMFYAHTHTHIQSPPY